MARSLRGRITMVTLAATAIGLGLVVAVAAAAIGRVDGPASVSVTASRGASNPLGAPLEPTSTEYGLPVPGDGAAWHDTHSTYPATDVFLGCGAELVSPVHGTVLEVRRVDSWDPTIDDPATRGGRSVAIRGYDGVRYYLAHLDTVEPNLAVGDRVDRGERLATMGDTGRTSACHLHFGISPPCPDPEWSVRRGVIWPYPYLDAWRRGEQLSPAPEVEAWVAANPNACANAATDP